MAWLTAIDQGVVRAMGVSAISPSIIAGWLTPHCRTCIPPIDAPATATRCVIPNCCRSRFWLSTMSRMVKCGKSGPRCVALLLGDVVSPLPIALVLTTNSLSVSSPLPGPIMKSIRRWFPLIAVTISTALDFAAFSVPSVA